MNQAAGPDPYRDPASGVLRNLLGITDPRELAAAEAALSASRLIDLERRRLPGTYDLDHLGAFHRYILGDVYEWAGELRTVSIAKRISVLPAAASGILRRRHLRPTGRGGPVTRTGARSDRPAAPIRTAQSERRPGRLSRTRKTPSAGSDEACPIELLSWP